MTDTPDTRKFVALYGGSFNLSTLAHRAVGAAVRDVIKPDEVWYLVSPQNPHKSSDGMADFYHRLEMAKLNVCGLNKLVVTDVEMEISKKTGSTASSDTLRELQKRFPDVRFAWIVGADEFVKFHTWHNYKDILDQVPVIVVPRAGFTDQIPTCEAAQYAACPQLSSAADVRSQHGWYYMKEFPEGSISATHERDRVNHGERPHAQYVHPAVSNYIAAHGLHF